MRDLLITGTDTAVGKTVIAAAVVAALRARGVRAVGFKPVETGIDPAGGTDSDILARASGERVALAAPLLRLQEPLAPAVAAERAGTVVDPDEIEARVRRLKEAGYCVVVEGAGGVLAPLCWGGSDPAASPAYTVLDLAEACDLDAIVVARPGLGTLNHTALTVMTLRAREIPIRGIVLNGRRDPPDVAESTNREALGRMLYGLRILETPFVQMGDPISHVAAIVDRLL